MSRKGSLVCGDKKKYNKHKYSVNKQNKTLEEHCGKCGGKHEPRKCPAYGRKCNKCSKFNHFARYCTNNRQVHTVEEDDYVFVDVIFKNQEMRVNNWQQQNKCV